MDNLSSSLATSRYSHNLGGVLLAATSLSVNTGERNNQTSNVVNDVLEKSLAMRDSVLGASASNQLCTTTLHSIAATNDAEICRRPENGKTLRMQEVTGGSRAGRALDDAYTGTPTALRTGAIGTPNQRRHDVVAVAGNSQASCASFPRRRSHSSPSSTFQSLASPMRDASVSELRGTKGFLVRARYPVSEGPTLIRESNSSLVSPKQAEGGKETSSVPPEECRIPFPEASLRRTSSSLVERTSSPDSEENQSSSDEDVPLERSSQRPISPMRSALSESALSSVSTSPIGPRIAVEPDRPLIASTHGNSLVCLPVTYLDPSCAPYVVSLASYRGRYLIACTIVEHHFVFFAAPAHPKGACAVALLCTRRGTLRRYAKAVPLHYHPLDPPNTLTHHALNQLLGEMPISTRTYTVDTTALQDSSDRGELKSESAYFDDELNAADTDTVLSTFDYHTVEEPNVPLTKALLELIPQGVPGWSAGHGANTNTASDAAQQPVDEDAVTSEVLADILPDHYAGDTIDGDESTSYRPTDQEDTGLPAATPTRAMSSLRMRANSTERDAIPSPTNAPVLCTTALGEFGKSGETFQTADTVVPGRARSPVRMNESPGSTSVFSTTTTAGGSRWGRESEEARHCRRSGHVDSADLRSIPRATHFTATSLRRHEQRTAPSIVRVGLRTAPPTEMSSSAALSVISLESGGTNNFTAMSSSSINTLVTLATSTVAASRHLYEPNQRPMVRRGWVREAGGSCLWTEELGATMMHVDGEGHCMTESGSPHSLGSVLGESTFADLGDA